MLRLSPLDIDAPEEPGDVRRRVDELLEKTHLLFERVHVTKQGKRIPVEINAVLFELNGRPTVLSVARDITERKKAEQALRESEARFRALAQSATDAIVSSDSRGNIIFWNKAAERMFGYSADQTVGRPLTSLIPEPLRESFQDAMRSRGPRGDFKILGKTIELAGLRKDGSEFPSELSLATWRAGGQRFYTAILRNVTERKKAEEALRGSEENFRSIFQSVPELLLVINSKMELLDSNRAFDNLIHTYAPVLKLPRTELRETLFSELEGHLGDRKRGLVVIPEASGNEGKGLILELEFAGRILAEEDEEEAIILSLRDITQRKRAEEAAQQRLQELEKFYTVTVGRELRMVELKKRIQDLEKKLQEEAAH